MQSLATTNGATLTTFLPCPSDISDPDLENPTHLRIARMFSLLPSFDAIILLSRLIFRYLGSYGSLTTLFMRVRNKVAAVSTSGAESSFTRSSNLVVILSASFSRAANEKQAAPAVLMSFEVNSLNFWASLSVTAGLKGATPNRPIMKFFIISSDRGIP